MNTYLIMDAALEALHHAYTLSFILTILLKRYYYPYFNGSGKSIDSPKTVQLLLADWTFIPRLPDAKA